MSTSSSGPPEVRTPEVSRGRGSKTAPRAKLAPMWLALAAVAVPRLAWACASCGSGTGDPLVLYPNERGKIYLGIGQSLGRQPLTYTGSPGHGPGPTAQGMLTVAAGLAVTSRAFVTLTVGGIANDGPQSRQVGVADPSLAARVTLLPERPATPWQPQVQLAAGFRPGLARSTTAGTARRYDRMDSFGDGNFELRGGLDVWWGRLPVKVGLAGFFLAPLSRELASGERSRTGVTYRLVATTGMDLGGSGRWVVSLLHDQQRDRLSEGRPVALSGRRVLSLVTAVDLFLGSGKSLRMSAGRTALALSRNATRDVHASLAFIQAW